MTREALLQRRCCENEDIVFGGITVSVTFGYYDDGRIGEVFLSTRKIGTAMDTAVRDMAVLLSIALQYGVTPGVLRRSLTTTEIGAPEGLAGKIVSMIEERQG
ncbi:hypothetical protein [Aurantimonas sp. NFXS3]|uniref:hypothetical protein n=1 Tax=Aurantimonas sp. NFXS3 TaxID=2818434 RepID=UPI003B8CC4F5